MCYHPIKSNQLVPPSPVAIAVDIGPHPQLLFGLAQERGGGALFALVPKGPLIIMVQRWAIGAIINVSGSIAINLGTNLMKLSHKVNKSQKNTVSDHRPFTTQYIDFPMLDQKLRKRRRVDPSCRDLVRHR